MLIVIRQLRTHIGGAIFLIFNFPSLDSASHQKRCFASKIVFSKGACNDPIHGTNGSEGNGR
jgi:hypothetical protein